jgi:hypothetical protein
MSTDDRKYSGEERRMGNAGWISDQKFVLEELRDIKLDLKDIKRELGDHRTEIAVIKKMASIYGGIAGTASAAIAMAIAYIKGAK